MSTSLVVLSGLLAGAVHVVTGVDHMAALLPLSVGRRWRAWGATVDYLPVPGEHMIAAGWAMPKVFRWIRSTLARP